MIIVDSKRDNKVLWHKYFTWKPLKIWEELGIEDAKRPYKIVWLEYVLRRFRYFTYYDKFGEAQNDYNIEYKLLERK